MNCSKSIPAMLAGAAAGFAGTVAMMAMRTFDLRYAPKTIPKTGKTQANSSCNEAEAVNPFGRNLFPQAGG